MSALKEQLGDWFPLYERVVKANPQSFQDLTTMLKAARTSKTVYPDSREVFRAFELCQLKDVGLVIIGQDPYHNGAATGLAFGVKSGFTINPSLRVIYKEICNTYGVEALPDFDYSLESWAKQGVLLMNTTLTVVKGHPNTHEKAWKWFTSGMIAELCYEKDNIVFLLWGKYAQDRFSNIIASHNMLFNKTHVAIKSAHPAAEVYGNMKAGFLGSNCFEKANMQLAEPIDWAQQLTLTK